MVHDRVDLVCSDRALPAIQCCRYTGVSILRSPPSPSDDDGRGSADVNGDNHSPASRNSMETLRRNAALGLLCSNSGYLDLHSFRLCCLPRKVVHLWFLRHNPSLAIDQQLAAHNPVDHEVADSSVYHLQTSRETIECQRYSGNFLVFDNFWNTRFKTQVDRLANFAQHCGRAWYF